MRNITPGVDVQEANSEVALSPFPAPIRRLLAVSVASYATILSATEGGSPDPKAAISEEMAALGLVVESIEKSEIAGLYAVSVEGGMLYVTQDGRYMIAGNLYEAREGRLVNLTEAAKAAERRQLLAEVDPGNLISFPPDGDTKASVFVFTDTDCGFCRQMHQQMLAYHERGIEVRYLAFPRAGAGSPTYDKMVSAWCSDDPRGALTALKRGEGVPENYCEDHPVGVQYGLGQLVGVAGTPSIVLPDGTMLPGYAPPEELAGLLGI